MQELVSIMILGVVSLLSCFAAPISPVTHLTNHLSKRPEAIFPAKQGPQAAAAGRIRSHWDYLGDFSGEN
jgi:hypothetical protein